MIAHRPQTIAIADRVLKLEKGKFVEVPSEFGWLANKEPSLGNAFSVMQFPILNEPIAANGDFARAVAGGCAMPTGAEAR